VSLSSDSMLKLMAYCDGELEGAERTEAEMLLASNVDAVAFIEQIAGLGELVERGHEARSGKAVASFDVADAVMALVKEEDKKDVTPSVVTSLAVARAREKKAAWSSALKIGGGIAAALALAASIFFFVQHRAEETPMAVSPTPTAAQPGPNGAPGTGVAVESAGKSVSVFYLPTVNELSTSVVVWVDETGEK
jgi:anti-sigma factor RsiW